MKPESSNFDEPDAEVEAQREAEAFADIAAGRLIPHDEVCAWAGDLGHAGRDTATGTLVQVVLPGKDSAHGS